jgi:alpha-mannosidase
MAARDFESAGSPRHVFGAMLRYRAKAGLSQDELGARVYLSGDMIGKVENGQRTLTVDNTAACDAALNTGGVLTELRDRLRDYLTTHATPGWVHEWEKFERQARTLLSWQPLLIPGLLQTREYAHAVFRCGRPGWPDAEIEQHVQRRLERQQILERDDPPMLIAVVDEGALRRPVGGPTVMFEQLGRLLELAARPKVVLQVVPTDAGPHPGTAGPMVLASFDDRPDVAYLDTAMEGQLVEAFSCPGSVPCGARSLRHSSFAPTQEVHRMRIMAVEPTDLFTGTEQRPAQIVRVTLVSGETADGERGDGRGDGQGGTATVRIEGPAVSTPRPAAVTGLRAGEERTVDVGVELSAPVTEGSARGATVIAEGASGAAARTNTEIVAAVPGWTMWMVSHFHYDPVWWNTQGQFTESRLLLPDENGKLPDVRTAFELVGLHLDMARRDPDYKFVLAEVDYLKPYFDTHPERRDELRALLKDGRVELVGGNYNEANTNLTCAESTIRNAVYGIGYQRDVLGGDPATAWMLDVFGHDPSYPSLMASAGLGSSAWARGPFHQWGPRGTVGDNTRMQFPSEFEWVSPDGKGLLTAYMPNHYGAGWAMERFGTLEAAEREAYGQFESLKPVAATRNVLLPVGADHVIPSRWCTQIHRDWNAKYVWPKFVTAVPREFFAAVRSDAAGRGVALTPQTRDMNPVYPGKDVSFIDTKQAQRAAETAVMDGERLATLAWLHGAPFPDAALDKAWRQLIFGGHHDAITGTESDQVYLDLLGGWREAYERGEGARRRAAAHLAGLADTVPPPGPSPEARAPADRAIVVFNTLARARGGLLTVTLRCERPGTGWLELRDAAGGAVPALAEGLRRHDDGTLAEVTLTFRAEDVPGLGYRTYWAMPVARQPHADEVTWSNADGAGVAAIENASFLIEADPLRGGALSRVHSKGPGTGTATELVTGGVANELVLQDEYDYHPRWNEGPWLLTPKGPGTGSATMAADVCVQRCPIGARLIARWSTGELRVTQETLLWDGAAHVEFRTHVDGSIGHDRLLRARFPLNVPGGLPVYETAAAVIGRPFGATDTDVGQHWFTLDNPAYTWFGLGGVTRVNVREPGGRAWAEAIGVAEVVTPAGDTPANPRGGSSAPGDEQIDLNGCRGAIRGLIAALARQGVTATCSRADGPRYGAIDLDSNLPDVRIAVGGPDANAFTAEVLAAAPPEYRKELEQRLASDGVARVWVPAGRSRADAFVPGADLRGARDLPVLVVAGSAGSAGLAAALAGLSEDIASQRAEAIIPVGQPAAGGHTSPLAGWSAALLNRGTPGCVVTPDGALNISLMRSCSGWPSGVWIDEPKRTAPDGSSFSWQHWSHTFEYALVAGPGDWRDAGFPAAGEAYNHPLFACETGVHPGRLPAAASLLEIEASGPGDVTLGALKPRGNPAAVGDVGGDPDHPDAITVRLREPTGYPARVAVRLPFTGVADADDTDLLEDADGGSLLVEDGNTVVASLPPSATITVAVTAGSSLPGRDDRATEPAQPVYTRYWLHGKGPAPAGYLPTAVHLSPTRITLPGGDAGTTARRRGFGGVPRAALRLTVATGLAPVAGHVELDVPDGLAVDPAGPLRYDLPAGGHAGWDLTVRATGPVGRYFLAGRIRDAAGLAFEDAVAVTVGEAPLPPLDTPLAELLPRLEADQRATAAELDVAVLCWPRGDDPPGSPRLGGGVTLRPGGHAEVAVRLANRARAQIRGEAQLVSPFGTWDAITPWTQGFRVDPGAEETIRYEVRVPAAAREGSEWWALVKVCYFGRLHYTAAIRVAIAS